jgi:TonB family protein
MTKREEIAFRKRSQNDPFADEGKEYPSEISSMTGTEDMTPGRKHHNKPVRSGKRTVLYIIVPAIVLGIISSVYYASDRNKTALQTDLNIPVTVPQESPVLNNISDPVLSESVQAIDAGGIKAEQEIADADTIKIYSDSKENPGIPDSTVHPAMNEVKDSNSYIPQDKTTIPASILNDSALKTENNQSGYISPQPVAGSSDFRKYIEENIVRPPGQPQGEEAVAIVSFVVLTTGIIDSIKVISSPGDEFAKEALRLIREGPAWKPAINNGLPIDDEVRLRIVFK